MVPQRRYDTLTMCDGKTASLELDTWGLVKLLERLRYVVRS